MHVEPRDGETFDQLLHRLKTSRDKAGILREKAKAATRRRTRRSRGGRAARPPR